MAYLLFTGKYDFRISQANGGDIEIIVNDYEDGASQTWAEFKLKIPDAIKLRDWLTTEITKQQEVDNGKKTA